MTGDMSSLTVIVYALEKVLLYIILVYTLKAQTAGCKHSSADSVPYYRSEQHICNTDHTHCG